MLNTMKSTFLSLSKTLGHNSNLERRRRDMFIEHAPIKKIKTP